MSVSSPSLPFPRPTTDPTALKDGGGLLISPKLPCGGLGQGLRERPVRSGSRVYTEEDRGYGLQPSWVPKRL